VRVDPQALLRDLAQYFTKRHLGKILGRSERQIYRYLRGETRMPHSVVAKANKLAKQRVRVTVGSRRIRRVLIRKGMVYKDGVERYKEEIWAMKPKHKFSAFRIKAGFHVRLKEGFSFTDYISTPIVMGNFSNVFDSFMRRFEIVWILSHSPIDRLDSFSVKITGYKGVYDGF